MRTSSICTTATLHQLYPISINRSRSVHKTAFQLKADHTRMCIYTMTQKTVQIRFCMNFVKFPPILIIFGRTMAKTLTLCEVHSFITSPNSFHYTSSAVTTRRHTLLTGINEFLQLAAVANCRSVQQRFTEFFRCWNMSTRER